MTGPISAEWHRIFELERLNSRKIVGLGRTVMFCPIEDQCRLIASTVQ